MAASDEPPAARAAAAALALHLTLRRSPAQPGWQADVECSGAMQHFDTLPALIAWLVRLDALGAPQHGIR